MVKDGTIPLPAASAVSRILFLLNLGVINRCYAGIALNLPELINLTLDKKEAPRLLAAPFLVDPRGIEPLISDCQPDVLPVNYGPVGVILAKISGRYRRMRGVGVEAFF